MGRFDCIYFVWSRKLFLIYDTNTKNVLRLFLIFTGILQQDEKEQKRPGSRGSAKSKASQEKEAEPVQISTPVQEEFWPVSTPNPCNTVYIYMEYSKSSRKPNLLETSFCVKQERFLQVK
jgi:hypothetical protein